MMPGTALPFDFNRESLMADASGALYWPDQKTLVVADLHLEKGSAYAKNGSHLPPYDSRETLRRLALAIDAYGPTRVICLGDSFHDDDAAGRLPDDDRATLQAMTAAMDWIWIAGNHDPAPPAGIDGLTTAEFRAGELIFRHEARKRSSPGEVSGHYHPKAGVSARGRRVTGRCFVADGKRLILPAFGAYTGGLDVHDPAIESLLQDKYTVLICGRARVHRIPREVVRRREEAEETREPRLI